MEKQIRVGFGFTSSAYLAELRESLFKKPVFRVKMGKRRINSDDLFLYDPLEISHPWLFEAPLKVQ